MAGNIVADTMRHDLSDEALDRIGEGKACNIACICQPGPSR